MAGERTNDNGIPVLRVKSNAGNNNDVTLWGDPTTHRLLCDVLISSATVAVATAAAPTYSEGAGVALSTDLSGQLRVTGSLSVGGTTDNSAFTAGSSTGTPAMGFYHSTIDTVTDGRAASLAIDSKRNLFVVIRDAAGNARGLNIDASGQLATTTTLGAETTKVIGTVRMLGNAGAIFDGATGAAVPANVIYMGLSDGTNLRGWLNAANALNSTGAGLGTAQMIAQFDDSAPTSITENSFGNVRMSQNRNLYGTIRDAAGNERGANVDASNNLNVALAAGSVAAGATSIADNEDAASADGDRGVKILVTRKATPANTSGSDGDYEFLQMSAGRLWTSTNIDQINGVAPSMGNGASGTGVQRVTIANDSTGQIIPVTGTTGGTTIFNLLSANSNNKTAVKASAGTIYSINVFNISANPVYLKLFDVANGSVTAGTTAATYQVPCPSNATAANGAGTNIEYPLGMAFSTAITIMLVTGISLTDNTSVAANIATVVIGYK